MKITDFDENPNFLFVDVEDPHTEYAQVNHFSEKEARPPLPNQ